MKTNTQYSELLEHAIKGAHQAGELLLEYLHKSYKISFKDNQERNLVTEADHASENFLIKHIQDKYPDHEILGEEGGITTAATSSDSADTFRWIIDPLDGTNNFSHKYPFFAVSIGIEHNGQIIAGVVHCPFFNETFFAEIGQGAYLQSPNTTPSIRLEVSKIPELRKALVATGFPPEKREKNFEYFKQILPVCHGLRRCGAAAIDLAYLACGRLDGFWEFGLAPWDVAAASLIITESGGQVTNMDGSPLDIHAKNILATNGHFHEELMGYFS